MHWHHKTGVALMTLGAALLACWSVPTVYGRTMAHLAVVEFRAQGGNHSLWDAARIMAYQQTLKVAMGEPEAILRVPKAGIEVPVFEGTSDLVLNRGVGHISGTAKPGEAGNMGITGHRDGFFRGLKDVTQGDRIEVQRNGSKTDTYVVERTSVVFPKDTSVLKNTNTSTLTLVTCYPFYYVGAAPQRFIVQAKLVSGHDTM